MGAYLDEHHDVYLRIVSMCSIGDSRTVCIGHFCHDSSFSVSMPTHCRASNIMVGWRSLPAPPEDASFCTKDTNYGRRAHRPRQKFIAGLGRGMILEKSMLGRFTG